MKVLVFLGQGDKRGASVTISLNLPELGIGPGRELHKAAYSRREPPVYGGASDLLKARGSWVCPRNVYITHI